MTLRDDGPDERRKKVSAEELAEVALGAWHNRLGDDPPGEPKKEHWETKPQDRISFAKKIAYGMGAFVNNLLAAAIGGMSIVLNLGFGMSPTLVGLLGALPRLTDAITDPLMGYISDNADTRWGRRRPFIFVGAIVAGLLYIALWQLPVGKSEAFYFWYFLGGSFLFYLAYTVFATPWVALGYELTPDFHERTRLMGVQNFIGQIPYVIAPWFLAIMTNELWFANQMQGAASLAIIVGITAAGLGVIPAIVLRERFKDTAPVEDASKSESAGISIADELKKFAAGMKQTVSSKPFVKLCVATFLVFNGFMLVSSFQFYVIIYWVTGGDQALGATFAGYAGTAGAIATFLVIIFVTWLGTKIGKRRAFFLATGISAVGYVMKWFFYTPENPWLVIVPAPFIAFGLGGLFTLMGSMIADVCDWDELQTHERREGMFGSIYWWVVKLGMAMALALGGVLLDLTGFNVDLGGDQTMQTLTLMRAADAFIPAITSLIAIWAVWSYPLTEQTAHEVRQKLEARRGAGAPEAAQT